MAKDKIIIKGAKEHNLKNIDLEIPRDKLVVFTGLSDSGKSSLAFDTIYADGQRRYMESLSSYARAVPGPDGKAQCGLHRGPFPGHLHRPENHLQEPPFHRGYRHRDLRLPAPALCTHWYSALPYLRQGDRAADGGPDGGPGAFPAGGDRIQILAPVVRQRKGEHAKEFESARRSGYVRVRVDGNLYDLSEEIKLEKNKKHTIEVVVDRLVVKGGDPLPSG